MMILTPHQDFDFVYWGCFLAGQWLFLLKRMALAVRSPMNALKNRRQYIYTNWDIILIRTAIEFAVIYYPYRHADLNMLVAKLGWSLPFKIPQAGVVAFGLGFLADFLLDWITMQDKILGISMPAWLKETVPQLPQVQQVIEAHQNDKKTHGPDVPEEPKNGGG